jgi:hypothetical protein
MKKILKTFSLMVALATVFVLGLNTAQAQDAAKPDSTGRSKFMVGVRAGLNVSRIRVNNGVANDFAEGAQVGLFAKYSFNDWVAVSLEGAWSQSGARNMPYSTPTVGLSGAFLLANNVQINPLLHFKVPVLSVYEPYVFVGPSFNVNFDNTIYYGSRMPLDAPNALSALDLGLLAGVGVDFNLRFAVLTLDARYRHGLNDIQQNSGQYGLGYVSSGGGPVSDNVPTFRTSQFSFQVGLGFPIGGK